MKKTYKPISRTEKASQMFKKKTLNLNDQFGIKKDEDNIENVIDYWETANSVIGNQTIDSIESTELHEESDTLFDLKNIRKSVQNKDNNNFNKTQKMNKILKKRKRLTLKPGSNDDNEFLEISNSEDKKDEQIINKNNIKNLSLENNDNVLLNQYEPALSFDESIKKSFELDSNELNLNSNETIKSNFKKEDQSNYEFDSKLKVETKSKNIKKNLNKDMKNNKKLNFKGQNSLIVENVREIRTVNKVNPLVCTDEINTVILELDYMAFTNEENAEKSFSIFVVKGKVIIKTGDKKTVLKNGEATVIRKNQLYSIICESKNAASLFISYAL